MPCSRFGIAVVLRDRRRQCQSVAASAVFRAGSLASSALASSDADAMARTETSGLDLVGGVNAFSTGGLL